MCIIANCGIDYNLYNEWNCAGDAHPICPNCQGELRYRDRRRRHIREEGGVKRWGYIRRLYCERCHRLHNELPSCLSPYKHYDAEVIEGVVDEVVTADDEGSEDYPCEKTMERWKQWIAHNRPFIEGYVRSIGFRLLNLGIEFLKAQESILDYLRERFHEHENHWLGIVNRLVYNTGASLEAWPHSAP